MKYRRVRVQGGVYFFTVVTNDRQPVFRNDDAVDVLKAAFKQVAMQMPYRIDALVVLPDHIHCIWRLPEGDSDFLTRWRLIKTGVTKALSFSFGKIWQKRYWEHLIRNEDDYRNHFDYIHYNPVKHGLASSPKEWKYSSFNKYLRKGIYSEVWGRSDFILPDYVGSE